MCYVQHLSHQELAHLALQGCEAVVQALLPLPLHLLTPLHLPHSHGECLHLSAPVNLCIKIINHTIEHSRIQ